MKNIHILSTDKPSWLVMDTTKNKLYFSPSLQHKNSNFLPKHIYITSNEEIKVGDWTLMFDSFGHLFLSHRPQQYLGIEKGHHLNRGLRKIILTTDKDLIKDGVQSIDDEFLEWFVKNPSCEEVEVDSIETNPDYKSNWENRFTYKIIIPKEEPKQETFEEAAERLAKDAYKKHSVKDDKLSLDEQIQRSGGFIVGFKEGMIAGAKWMRDKIQGGNK